ncbi:MAG: thiol-disulfide oxidoreductase DCC family protein [Chitinophagaceae bacterium]
MKFISTFARMKSSPIILFDGVCNFCNYWVNFAIKRDRKKKLRFTPLQGETAKRLLPEYTINPTSLSSVILIDNGKAYTQSSAAIRICKHLNGGWKLFYGLIIIPKFVRDFFYNIIARNRYKWFGKKDQCMIPPADWKERFLD